MTTGLGLQEPAAGARIPRSRGRRALPEAADHVLYLLGAFVAAAAVAVWCQHQEGVAAVLAAADDAASQPAVDHLARVWNQGHRWSQSAANMLLGPLVVTFIDRCVFRAVTLPEVWTNRPLAGREHVFRKLDAEVRAAGLRFYGVVYAASILAPSVVLGV